ncbi:hypothetical protein Naga_100902g1, partial [Nannochloropsis gaditana]
LPPSLPPSLPGGLDWVIRLLAHSRRYLQTLDLFEVLSSKGVVLRASSFNVVMEELAAIPKWREVIKVIPSFLPPSLPSYLKKHAPPSLRPCLTRLFLSSPHTSGEQPSPSLPPSLPPSPPSSLPPPPLPRSGP